MRVSYSSSIPARRAAAVSIRTSPGPRARGGQPDAVGNDRGRRGGAVPARWKLPLDALGVHPVHGRPGLGDQHLHQAAVGLAERDLRQVAPEIVRRVRLHAEAPGVPVGEAGEQVSEVVDPVVNEPEPAPGKGAVSTLLRPGSLLQHQDRGALLAGRKRGAEGGVAGPDHYDVIPRLTPSGAGPQSQPLPFTEWLQYRRRKTDTLVGPTGVQRLSLRSPVVEVPRETRLTVRALLPYHRGRER